MRRAFRDLEILAAALLLRPGLYLLRQAMDSHGQDATAMIIFGAALCGMALIMTYLGIKMHLSLRSWERHARRHYR